MPLKENFYTLSTLVPNERRAALQPVDLKVRGMAGLQQGLIDMVQDMVNDGVEHRVGLIHSETRIRQHEELHTKLIEASLESMDTLASMVTLTMPSCSPISCARTVGRRSPPPKTTRFGSAFLAHLGLRRRFLFVEGAAHFGSFW